MPAARPSPLAGYLAAVLSVLAAALLRAGLDPYLGDAVPFAFFFIAVTGVAFYVDLWPALAATGLSLIVGRLLFVSPRYALAIRESDAIVGAFFVLACALVIGLATRVNRSRARMEEAAAEAKSQAAAVQRERTRLRQMISSIPGVVWEAWGEPDSAKQRIDYVSDYVEQMLGYTPAEWTATPNFWLQIVAPDDREAAARVAAESFAAATTGENEFRWMRKDGDPIWVLARSTVIKDDGGRPVGMRGVTFDITDRKQAERQLELLAEFSTIGLARPSFADIASHIARRVAEVIGDGCFIRLLDEGQLKTIACDHRDATAMPFMRALAGQTDLASVSRFYADALAAPRTVVVDDVPASEVERLKDLVPAEQIEQFRARRRVICPLVSAGRVFGTLTLGRAAGAPYTSHECTLVEAVAARAALLLDNARLLDAAHREADEARLARAAAEEAGRVKDEFLATLSHELRTPLNAILGWAHILQDPRLPPERHRTAIDTIVRNAQSQEQLIADILDVQRIMAGKIRLALRTADLGNIVRAAAETVQPSAEAKGIRIQLLIDLDAPPINVDSDRLKQVVWNLLSNAIKFAPQGGRVQVRLLKTEGGCDLIVEDNGPGIAPEFIPFMFERFRQADSSTTRTHKGLGLGLAIVRSLVEMHGGTISAGNVSEPDQTGAIFTIRLPLQAKLDRAADVDGPAPETPLWLDGVPSLAGVRVLVVEDDGDARELIRTILDRCGAAVTTAPSASEGYEAFVREIHDVLISDIEMPEEDGYSLIRRIRTLPPEAGGDTPAAALTAYASAPDRMRVFGAGFNIHMAKPVQPAELATVVASLTGRRFEPAAEASR